MLIAIALSLFSATLTGCLGGSVTLGGGGVGVTVGTGGVGVRVGGGGVGVEVGSRWPTGGENGPAGDGQHGLMRKPVASGRLTSRFGAARGARTHKGVDYSAPAGTPVYAAGDGVVEEVRVSASYGNLVRIRHADGLDSGYAHLAAFADGLHEGATVKRGQMIGAVGSTGRSTRPHLHYEVRRDGRFIDPLG